MTYYTPDSPYRPQPQPTAVVLPTVKEVRTAIIMAEHDGGWIEHTVARAVLDLIASRVPAWQPVEPGTVIKAGTRVRRPYLTDSGAVEHILPTDTPANDGWCIDPRTVPAEPRHTPPPRRRFLRRALHAPALEADPDTAAEHVAGLLSIADTHVECPTYCGDCGEPLADMPCDHCGGSGCGLGVGSGAYEECGWCAGVGKVHVGCAHLSYAELCADRDALAAKLDHMTEARDNARDAAERLEAILDGRCLSDITHRDEGHRQSVCMLPEGHAPLMHDDCTGCTWTDAAHWQQSAVDRVADEVQRIVDESQHEGWDGPLVRILVGRISAALEGSA